MRYKELEQAFKAIHDEYVASDSFKQWAAAKEAWEGTETYKTDPGRYRGSQYTYPNFCYRNFYNGYPQPERTENYSSDEEDYNLYKKFCYLCHFKNLWDGNYNIRCPRLSQSQEKFDLKRKLLLIEHGLSPDTKLPSEWYWGGYEWDWS